MIHFGRMEKKRGEEGRENFGSGLAGGGEECWARDQTLNQ
jgi:hypothetical protein